LRRYEQVVLHIRQRIEAGSLKLNERLPSVREMSEQTGFSMVTVHHAYALLESDGIVAARPRSGFFVARLPRSLGTFSNAPSVAPNPKGAPIASGSLNFRVMASWHNRELEAFGAVYPSEDLFSRRNVRRILRQILLHDPARFPELEAPQGDPVLRAAIARRAAQRGIIARTEDVLITGNGLQGLDLCIAALAKPGDTVLVETPTFFPLLDALRRRQIMALELYSHPRLGIDADQFNHLLKQHGVAACVLMPVNHCPTGVTYSADTMRKIARIACERKVPVIENDAFGGLSYDGEAVPSIKSFDTDGYVVLFSSLPGLSPSGYGISWVITDRFYNDVLEQKFFTNLFGGDGPLQRAAAEYLAQGSYNRQLRSVQNTLQSRMQRGLGLLADYLPKGAAVSNPAGGFMCWLRGPQGFDAVQASERALAAEISLAGGPMFSPTSSFRNFLGLNFSFEWTPAHVEKLKTVAAMMAPALKADASGPAP
jgi:DNA-binding transcriptional MocR family regulator